MISQPSKKKIYVCYDLINDAHLRDFVIAQSKKTDSPFIVIDYSRKCEPPENVWKEKLKKTLTLLDLMFVMVGKKAFKASNVLEEVDIAYKLNKPIMQFCDPNAKYAECKLIANVGKLYKWEWENLKQVMNKFKYRTDI